MLMAGLAIALLALTLPVAAAPGPSRGDPALESALPVLLRLEDSRDGPGLALLARHASSAVRARVARALGRVQDERFVALLERMSDDPAGSVRLEALFALGQQWSAAGERGLMRVAARRGLSLPERLRILEGLGKCASWDGPGRRYVVTSLSHGSPAVRARAALALGLVAWREHRTRPAWEPGDAPVAALSRLARDPAGSVARAATYALYRLAWTPSPRSKPAPSSPWRLEALAALKGVSGHGSPEIRSLATQGVGLLLAATDGPLPAETLARFGDADWRVRACVAEASARVRDAALDERLAGLLSDSSRLVRVAALRALATRRPTAPTVVDRVEGLERESVASPQVRGEALVTLAVLDAVRARVVLETASNAPSPSRRRDAARGWSRLLDGPVPPASEAARIHLHRLSRDPSARVREAALEGLAGARAHRDEVVALLMDRLLDRDGVVRAIAADGLAQLKAVQAVPRIVAALRALDPGTDVEVAATFVEALGVLGEVAAAPILGALTRSPQPALAEAAAKALSAVAHRPVKARPGRAVARPVPPAAMAFVTRASRVEASGGSLRMLLETEEGALVLRLHVREAPLTCWNLVRLARSGYFNGLVFHRVVPNFVAQGGDPRGDGWGGPGRTMRCETNPLAYERGAVGMALAGKDTGGSQFFLAHSWQPHLDGHYTIFATLERGGDVLDRLGEGTVIRTVRVVEP